MAQTVNIEARGLVTNPNELSISAGALLEADNVNIDRDNTISLRRGFAAVDNEFIIGAGEHPVTGIYFQGQLIVHTDENRLWRYEPGFGWIGVGNPTQYEPPDATEGMRFQKAGKSLYFTTTKGVFKLDALTSDPVRAGAIKAVGAIGEGALTSPPGGGWFDIDRAVAYRIVWGYDDENDVRVLGTPSPRLVIANNSVVTQYTQVTWSIPDDYDSKYFFQIYRSNQSASADTVPDDNMVKVYERKPTSNEATLGRVTIVDTVADDENGESLYTNPTQTDFGILDANERPPIAQDVCVYKDHTFYANVVQPHRLGLSLIAVGGDTGLAVNTQIKIVWEDGVSMFVQGSGVDTGNFFFVDASASVQSTARLIVEAINRTTTRLKAYYVSGFGDSSGQILLENVDADTPGFYVWSTMCPEAWTPTMPVACPYGQDTFTSLTRLIGGTTVEAPGGQKHGFKVNDVIVVELRDGGPADPNIATGTYVVNSVPSVFNFRYANVGVVGPQNATSRLQVRLNTTDLTSLKSKADTFLNGLYFSKPQLPEYVPLVNFFQVGDAEQPIQRILPLRDSLIIMKPDGVWRLTGTDRRDFAVYPLDLTTSLKGANTACVGMNRVWANTNQGVVTITDTSVVVLSRPIEEFMLRLDKSLAGDWDLARAVFYETDKKLLLFHPLTSGDTSNTKTLVFNAATDAWTTWTLTTQGVLFSPENKLVLCDPEATVQIERKTLTVRDFADNDFGVTIVTSIGSVVELSDVSDVNVGDVLYESDSVYSVVTEVTEVSNVVTVNDELEWTPGAARIYPKVRPVVRWAPLHLGNAGVMKQFREITAFFRKASFATASLGFATDVSPGFEDVAIEGYEQGGWGLTPFGEAPFGEEAAQESVTIRTYIPRNKQRANLLYMRATMDEAWAWFEWQGAAVTINGMSERTGK